MKTAICICTYANLEFTKLAVKSIQDSVIPPGHELHVALIVGKPGDNETLAYARALRDEANPMGVFHDSIRYHWLEHKTNRGFAASCNDMIDFVKSRNFDNLIIMGNDVVAYPGAIHAMLVAAEKTPYEWICASQFDVQALVNAHPETRACFSQPNFKFTDFSKRPWEAHLDAVASIPVEVHGNAMSDVQNLCLFKRSVFEKIGYFDPGFWPNGYFSDNDYCRRAVLERVNGCRLPHAVYFHFWSRTMNQVREQSFHDRCFDANEKFYVNKWGGRVGHEKFTLPFNGQPVEVCDGVTLPTTVFHSRRGEDQIVEWWEKKLKAK